MRLLLPLSLLLFASLAPCASADAPPSASPDKLTGVWGASRVFGPEVQGPLTLDGRGTDWQAEIAGYRVPVTHDKDGIRFSLPGDRGSFRGKLSADGKSLTGFWTQPAGVTLGTPYATPVTLHCTEAGVWHGRVDPLPDAATLYLSVAAADDGSLHAFFRNPEGNLGARGLYKLSVNGTAVTLQDLNAPDRTFTASYDAGADQLTLHWPDAGDFTLTRRGRDDAPGFYPATPAAPYAYRQPVLEDDGWKTATPAAVGLDPKPLTALVQKILDTPTDGPRAPYIHSLLVARHGKLVLEEYFYGFDREQTHDSRSAGKTFAGTLVGIALDHGAKFTPESPAYALFPEYKDFANPDPRKQKVTVQDLMTMDSGLACDDNDDNSPGNEDTMQAQSAQPDWYKFALDLPMQDEPGDGKAVYCTAGINLLGGIVRNTTHRTLLDLFQQYYAGPLDFRDYHVNLMPTTGDMYVGGGIQLRPRDLLKLGQLYLDHGVWNGHRVLSAKWADLATRQYSAFPATPYAPGHGYGYTWHLFEVQAGGKTYKEYMAQGNGGQLVMVVPELDLVAEFTAGNYNAFPVWRSYFEQLLPQYILPAATH